MYLRALQGLGKAESYHGIDFIQLATWALHDQMVGHLAKVLLRREEAGLWYLVRKNTLIAGELCAQHGIQLRHVEDIETGLALVRDRTLFHLDKRGVRNPRDIWKKAALTWGELEDAIDASLRLLCLLHKEIRGTEFPLPCYDGSDATKIAEHAYKHGLLFTGKAVDPTFAALFDS